LGETATAGEEQIIELGDKLQVFVPGLDTADQMVDVDFNGEVDLVMYGKVRLAGYDIKRAVKKLKLRLTQYLKSVEGVSIAIRQKGRIVMITGCVVKPGPVNLEPSDDLWRAIHRAGGLTPCADTGRVVFFRGGTELRADLNAYLSRDSDRPLPILKTGDTVFVPSMPGHALVPGVAESFLGQDSVRHSVFVIGAVATPAMYPRPPDRDVLTAVAMAHGPTAEADLSHTILLTSERSTTIDLQKRLAGETSPRTSLPSEGGAIVYIPTLTENIDTRLGDFINVIGAFKKPGRIPVSGPVKLIDAIGLAGGVDESARLKTLRVVEEGLGYTLVSELNLKRYLTEGGGTGRMMVKPGSTLYLDKRNWETATFAMSTVSMVGMLASTVLLWLTAMNTI
jgi:protein involved in polysaccharide export with SLBB domain